MSDDAQGPAQVPQMWREYIIRLPKQLADALDKGLSLQKEMEDREIENSEYWAWLLMLGIMEVQRQNSAAKQGDARIIEPGANGFGGPKCVHCDRSVYEPGGCHALHPARSARAKDMRP